MRLKLICCEILYREACALVARSSNRVDVEFLPKGLHDIGARNMLERLQQAVDRTEPDSCDAVLLGYALCGNGLIGLAARSVPLVLPRGHDCITLFLGSKERYLDYFNTKSGVYFKTSGWIERGENAGELKQLGAKSTGLGFSYQELVEKYGEENAAYLYEQFNRPAHYRQFTYIETGVEPDDRFERHTVEEAGRRGWSYEKIQGDLGLLRRLIEGEWNDGDFLVVPPGRRIAIRYDESIVGLEET